MTMEDIVRQVTVEMGIPQETAQQAIDTARMTMPGALRVARTKISKKQQHIMRMYFRTLLYRIATDPEYKRALREEIRKQVERN